MSRPSSPCAHGCAGSPEPARAPGPDPPRAAGGGSARHRTRRRLRLVRRRGRPCAPAAARLLVSGTGRGELADIIAAAGLEPAVSARIAPAQVTLGRDARSTRGNARETADWAAAHGMGSLIVVTSGYHMRRALWELRRTLPAAVQLRPAPLVPHLPDGQDHVPLRLLASEYAKWLGAMAGLSAWVAREEEASAPAPAMQRPTQ